jgi:hypothetical protein
MARVIARETIALSASQSNKTLLQIAASATKPLRLKEVGISLNGVDAARVPVQFDLCHQSSAGSGSSPVTVVGQDSLQEGVLATAIKTPSSEPTTGAVVRSWFVTPAGGLFVAQFPLGDEIWVGTSARLGIRYSSGASISETAALYLVCEE